MYSFDIERPTTLADALAALADDEAQALGGGQTLIPTLKQRLASPSKLVCLSGIEELKGISRDGDTLQWLATAHDPEILAEPWELRPRIAQLTDDEILEAPPCIDRDLDHIVENLHHDNVR